MSLTDFYWQYNTLNESFPDIGALGNFIGNHDQTRWLLDSPDYMTYKSGLTAAFFLPGVPIAYYGDEQGQRGNSSDTDKRLPLWSHGGYNTQFELYTWTAQLIAARKRSIYQLPDELIDRVLPYFH